MSNSELVPPKSDPRVVTTEVPLVVPASNRWILFGSLALLLGLIMGFIMSSLGK
jgi:hypothetical protein